jgi:hypothetical protein
MLLKTDVLSALFVVAALGLFSLVEAVPAPEMGSRPHGVAVETSFASDVLPSLEARCWECHSEESAELGLKLDTYEGVMAGSDYGTVVEPGNPDGSLLIEMIESGDMPEDGDPVTPDELEVLRAWIAAGAENN